VHDSVLTTLLLAANAEDAEAEKAAAESAANALTKLRNTDASASKDESISINSLFSALEVAIHRQSQRIQIESEGSTNYAVPVGVASAITEATLQALANAINHAGQAVTIQVFLKGSADGLKIVVKDNGRGFRPSRVPKNRIGLRLSIIGRMQAVGGKVFIDSKIGVGTNVIIEWSAP
jgi:signal transduction histidine kinase